jgi:hypothetical protein
MMLFRFSLLSLGLSFVHSLVGMVCSEFQGHHTNQAYHKSGIMSPEYREIRGVDGELWLRVKLE